MLLIIKYAHRRYKQRQGIYEADDGDAAPLYNKVTPALLWGSMYGTEHLDPSHLRKWKATAVSCFALSAFHTVHASTHFQSGTDAMRSFRCLHTVPTIFKPRLGIKPSFLVSSLESAKKVCLQNAWGQERILHIRCLLERHVILYFDPPATPGNTVLSALSLWAVKQLLLMCQWSHAGSAIACLPSLWALLQLCLGYRKSIADRRISHQLAMEIAGMLCVNFAYCA